MTAEAGTSDVASATTATGISPAHTIGISGADATRSTATGTCLTAMPDTGVIRKRAINIGITVTSGTLTETGAIATADTAVNTGGGTRANGAATSTTLTTSRGASSGALRF